MLKFKGFQWAGLYVGGAWNNFDVVSNSSQILPSLLLKILGRSGNPPNCNHLFERVEN